jgi:DNA-binding NarL/FixJ family response regulator
VSHLLESFIVRQEQRGVGMSRGHNFVQVPNGFSTVWPARSTEKKAAAGLQSNSLGIVHRANTSPTFGESEIGSADAGDQELSRDASSPAVHESSNMADDFDNSWRGRFTPKEIRILEMLVEGSSCEAIAAALDTSEKTVRNYLRALACTTGSSDLSELAEFTVAHRVLERPSIEY